ncbi:MAG: leucyl/phenylalanyl-tRNA--protein transferase [Burkholderiales bacterium PBB4]|nr:MAG: leucyl/phenylalanyl-tRNA--protein transferase [Burkholderiales bacterium PBB4]
MTSNSLTWLETNSPLPAPETAWGRDSEAPGLLAAGGDLTPARLLEAYSNGIFPWFSDGQPILWWSPDPRMVLKPTEFRLHRSLRQALKNFVGQPDCVIRIDSQFASVIHACATSPRNGQQGTWIVPKMVNAYTDLHTAGFAHSVETWMDGKLVGGLYCVAIGKAIFGESMFAAQTDASKIALAALVALCREHHVPLIDCQQNTRHLASLGAGEIARTDFLDRIRHACLARGPDWQFSPLYWEHMLSA